MAGGRSGARIHQEEEMKILIADAFDDSLPGRLAAFGEVTSDAAKIADADVLLVRSKTKVTKEYLAGAPNLKLIIRGGVGLDNIDVEAARGTGIEVKNTPRASSIAVAELTMALMLSVPNRIIEGHNGIKEGKFLKKELKRTELYGKTLGLLGAGLIGTEVARRAIAFGMRVVAHDHYISNHALAELIEDDDEFYSVCDYISVHLPLTAETKGMIDRNTIAKMKDGVILLNTARGKVVVEEDLAEALKSGKVRAYATDVYASDPPPASSPILSAPNVVMTPHIGGSSKENLLRIGNIVVDMLRKWRG
jgi:D-3-phosphoglycerate dehydrogenase